MTSEVRHPERSEGSPEEDRPPQGEILRFAQRLFRDSGAGAISRHIGRSAICTLAMTLLSAGGGLFAAAHSQDVACISLCEEQSAALPQTRCLDDELETAEKELEALLTAARKEWEHVPDDSIDPEMRAAADAFSKAIPESLDAAQKEWLEYMSADCGAAGAVWTNGSGRRPAVLVCRIDRVRRRSLDIWKVYLEPDAALPRPAQLCE